ncbi:dynamin family protein [Serratia fonticola]
MPTPHNPLVDRVAALLASLTDYGSRFPEEIADLKSLQDDLAQKLARWQQHEHTLNIGIMGQVKAGKSTFLNALLFDGRVVLPVAATPKTANLTRIMYGERYSLQVEFYTQEEWQGIEAMAERSGDSDEIKVARELLGMVRNAGLDLPAHWQALAPHTDSIDTLYADDLAGLQGVLNRYTGNDGQYTALVKATVLTLPDEALKGFAVVDTPGMNDPVQSRSQKTRDYMANCDVVFFLSRCSQFMDESDHRLLSEQLPGKGVKRLVLVAGQFDSAILDDGYDRSSLQETEHNITDRLQRGVREKVDTLVKLKTDAQQTALAELLGQLAFPVFSSTFAQGFAHWPEEQWSDSMKHMHQQLTDLAADVWKEGRFDRDDWQRIANFDALKLAYQQARQDRLPLLEKQKNSFIDETETQLLEILQTFDQRVAGRISALSAQDIQSLMHQQSECEKHIARLSSELTSRISGVIEKAHQRREAVCHQLSADRQYYAAQLHPRTGSQEVQRSYEVSNSTWYKPWTYFSTRTVYYTSTISYDYLDPADAIEQVREYGQASAAQISENINTLIHPSELRSTLRDALLNHLDTRSERFDPAVFKAALDSAISRLQLPTFNMDLGDTTTLIPYKDEVRESDKMAQLRHALDTALLKIHERLQSSFEQGVSDVVEQLTTLMETLHHTLTQESQAELQQLREGLANKEQEIAHYAQLRSMLGRYLTASL